MNSIHLCVGRCWSWLRKLLHDPLAKFLNIRTYLIALSVNEIIAIGDRDRLRKGFDKVASGNPIRGERECGRNNAEALLSRLQGRKHAVHGQSLARLEGFQPNAA